MEAHEQVSEEVKEWTEVLKKNEQDFTNAIQSALSNLETAKNIAVYLEFWQINMDSINEPIPTATELFAMFEKMEAESIALNMSRIMGELKALSGKASEVFSESYDQFNSIQEALKKYWMLKGGFDFLGKP